VSAVVTCFALGCWNVSADQLDTWFRRNPIPTGERLWAVGGGRGLALAFPFTGGMLVSRDNKIWFELDIASERRVDAVTVGDPGFVAVTRDGDTLFSTNGTYWVPTIAPAGSGLSTVMWGNGLFVAVRSHAARTSPDGILWSDEIQLPKGYIKDGCFGDGQFVLVTYDADILTSTDTIEWTVRLPGDYGILTSVAFGSGTYVSVGSWGRIERSVDGKDWQRVPVEFGGYFYGLAHGNSRFVAVGGDADGNPFLGVAFTSPDGKTWTRHDLGQIGALNDVDFVNGQFLAVGENGVILTSLDGETWELRTTGVREAVRGAAYGGGNYLVTAAGGLILASKDGVVWTERETGFTNVLSDVAYGSGVWVGVGGGGTIFSSEDGERWTSRSVETSSSFSSVEYTGNLFLAIGGEGTYPANQMVIWWSTDGALWSKWHSPCFWHCYDSWLTDAVYSPKHQGFVAVGPYNTVASNNGSQWFNLRGPGGNAITEHDGLLVIVGDRGIFTATRGDQWTQVYQSRVQFTDVVWFNGSYVATGISDYETGVIFRSMDGTNWTQITTLKVTDLYRLAAGTDSLVAVGRSGTIMHCPPGSDQMRFLSRASRSAGDLPFYSVLEAPRGSSVVVERSDDLSLWTELQSSTNWLGQGEIIDRDHSDRRFYRAKLIGR
jgi:hypothetical protein